MQPTQVYYNAQSHAMHSLKVYIATQYTKKDVIWGKRQKEQPKADLWLSANHRHIAVFSSKSHYYISIKKPLLKYVAYS